MQKLDALVPDPIYDEKTLPKEKYDVMFAQDFAGTSGNLETDNNAVAFLQAATNTQRAIEEEEAPVEEVEKTDIIGDIE